ncbi:MAG: RnfABCDGE type electron transport complex subunit D, partial [Planctomycetota bacterium]
MKALLRLFDRMRPNFEEGGRLRPLKPAFEAVENFFFGPAARTGKPPHVRDAIDSKRYMGMAMIAVMPSLFAAVYFFGLRVIAMMLVCYAVGLTIEILFAIVRKEEVNEGFLVTGMMFPLVLPPGLPFWAVA